MSEDFNPIDAINESDKNFRREAAKLVGWLVAGGSVALLGAEHDNALMVCAGMALWIPGLRSIIRMDAENGIRNNLIGGFVEDLTGPEPLQD